MIASLAQRPATGSPSDSLAALRARVARDSTDGRAWFDLGRATWRTLDDVHAHRGPVDTAWVTATAAEASHAFARAATLRAGTSAGDSARALQVFVWSESAFLGWELGDTAGAAAGWAHAPTDLHLPPVLGELAENLLRACPRGALILTENISVTYAAWALRYGRGLRPDLLTIPIERLRADTVVADRVAAAAKIHRPGTGAGTEVWVKA
ncbi:MAG TPA: hypothetical protein VNG95_00575, partial [Gemmatimonadales bacterium]|nr:hypothetical protein [Gemmatimonadales bacterium]